MEHLTHLSKDKKLKKLLETVQPYELQKRKNICLRLCASIMSQQLSTKVAQVIYKRFLDLYGGEEPTPQQIVDTSPTVLRSIGLSNAKVNYVQNVARFAIEHGMDEKRLHGMTNEEVIEYLTAIKGVGKWTVEMLLMFTLGREDVFAVDDLGIQQSMIKLYKLNTDNKKLLRESMLKISGKWSPYRTYACFYLWRWKDDEVKAPKPKKAIGVKSKKAKSVKAKKAKRKKITT
jgi:DNA-3-methyladenine glycosylase II